MPRAERIEEACQWLQASLKAKEDHQGENVYAPFLLAIANHKLNRPEEARSFLDRGVKLACMARYMNWRFNIIRNCLQHEAIALLATAAVAPAAVK